MNTFSPGLSDSIASVIADPPQCPHCDSSSHIAGGLCVGCLLQAGLDPDDECAPETLVSALAEITLPDKNWRLGNYEILEEIGRGGMGVIYRARQRHSRRIVAVKRVLGYHADSRETLARFRREAQAAASLDHPNILPIYEVSESEDGLPFFSMKFAPGGSLQEVAPALRNDPRQCVALVTKVARAVQHAHAKGILHRDLKPGNILMDAHGEPLVSDFGLAKWLDTTSDLTRTLTIFGTPGYIAPEQASASAADLKPTADVYSLGAILFDLLAGRPPFLGAHALSVIRQAAESPAPKLRTLSKLADRDLETICAHCLERDPGARYPSAHGLAEDLERWLEGRPIIARPVLPPTKLWRWSKRNPWLAAIAVICLALAIGTGVRQIETKRLRSTVDAQVAAKHSIEVMPIFDLDQIAESTASAAELAVHLQKHLMAYGPATVRAADKSRQWKSRSNLSEHARSIISATRRRVNGKTRISIRLLDARTGELLAQHIKEDGDSWIASIAHTISENTYRVLDADDLSSVTKFAADPGLQDPNARNFITAGLTLADRRTDIDLDRSIECLKRALNLQPNSAGAHAALAKVLTYKVAATSNRAILPRAEEAALRAISLNPTSGEAHHALAVTYFHQGKIADALEQMQQAFECSGMYSRGATVASALCKIMGRPDQALSWLIVAQNNELQPGDNEAGIADCWIELGEDERAEAAYRRHAELRPEQPSGWIGICRLRMLNGRHDEARTLYRDNQKRYSEFIYTQQIAAQVEFFARNFTIAEQFYKELEARDPDGGGSFYGGVSYKSALGRIKSETDLEGGLELLRAARKAEHEVLEVAPSHPEVHYRLAAIEASLGDKNAAFEHLERALSFGWIDHRSLGSDPRFDRLRDDARFEQQITKLATRVAELRRQQPSH